MVLSEPEIANEKKKKREKISRRGWGGGGSGGMSPRKILKVETKNCAI